MDDLIGRGVNTQRRKAGVEPGGFPVRIIAVFSFNFSINRVNLTFILIAIKVSDGLPVRLFAGIVKIFRAESDLPCLYFRLFLYGCSRHGQNLLQFQTL